jgi:hypothetical protein
MKPFNKSARGLGKPAAPAMNGASDAREKGSEAFLSAEKWLEHLEEEIEPTCSAREKEDLDLLLKNSECDLAVRESLRRVRAAVKSLDDVALPESGHYYDTLHSKIMAAIEDDVAMNGGPVQAPAKRAAFFSRGVRLPQAVFGALGMTMMIAILALVGLRHSPDAGSRPSVIASEETQAIAADVASAATEENFERKIAMVDPQTSAKFARDMASFESEEDFLTETAAARLKHLSASQADALIRSLKR